jgi:FtsZ-interacting cell division protein YlmF
MASFDLPQVVQVPKPEQFRSEAFRKDAFDRERGIEERNVNLQRLAEALDRRPIDEIAALVRALTYGDMIELAEEIWRVQPQSLDMSKDALPRILYRWSTSRST